MMNTFRALSLLALLTIAVVVNAAACSAGIAPSPTPQPSPTPTPTTLPAPPATVPSPEPVTFPQDEAPHQDPIEWWYYNGHVQDADGQEYGFHFVIFQARSAQGAVGYMAHASVTDLQAGAHAQASRISGEPQPQPAEGFRFTLQDWRLTGTPDRHAFSASADGYALDLDLTPGKPAVLHDEDGFLIGPEGWTYYYSWTRMDAAGTLTKDGRSYAVTGEGWMDHQWGDFTVQGYPAGWQWFAIQFEDGRDLMVYQLRDGQGQMVTLGTLVDPDGSTRALASGELRLEVLDHWTSPHTNAEYPSRWALQVPSADLTLEITPRFADQEVTVAFPPSTIYWEGLSTAEGTWGGQSVKGDAYVELVGYVQFPRMPSGTPTGP